MVGSVPHASARRRCADLAGRVPLRQISNHAAAKNRIAIQQAILRAAPGRAGGFAGFLGRVQLSVYPSFCLKGLMHDE